MLSTVLASRTVHGDSYTMLIASERHTPNDLELWRELEQADLIHGERLMRSGKVAQSIEAIQRFAADGCDYAGWSGGKDSTVLIHLLSLAGVKTPILYVKGMPVANPDTQLVKAALPFKINEKVITYTGDDQHDNRVFFGAFRDAGQRYFSGIRADESGGRKIRMRKFGLTSANACAPLGWWTAQDCFGYLAIHGLPVHSAYAMLGGGRWDRKQIRVDELNMLPDAGGVSFGRDEWEREYYGDVLNKLATAAQGEPSM